MTREQAKTILENVEAIKAWSEGGLIQVRIKQGMASEPGDAYWRDYQSHCPNFDNPNWEWRIKPEPPKPREFWLVAKGQMPYQVFLSSPYSYQWRAIDCSEIIHVREVVDQ